MARPETDLQGEVVALCGGLGLDLLLQGIARQGYRLVGPTVRNGAIGVDVIDGAQDLPQGWTDQQAPGSYRILRRDDQAYFGFSSPPGGWKRYLFPAHSVLWRSTTHGDGIEIKPASDDPGPTAFIGIRSCDLAAIEIQDRIFLSRGNPDPIYEARRENLLLIGVDCREPGPLCFCESMDCGPRADGADLRITELGPDDPATHRFVVRAQTPLGSDVLAGSGIEKIDQSARPVDMDDLAADRFPSPADDCVPGRVVNTDRLAELLVAEAESPVWDDIAERCLACGNCTMVCPTCFCSDVDDLPVIPPGGQERIRQWASCFELDHSYIHGGSIRQSIKSRYRQWLTHKFSSWWDQFGSSGCVGCGRCIASCPVGIDVTESLAAIRDGAKSPKSPASRAGAAQ